MASYSRNFLEFHSCKYNCINFCISVFLILYKSSIPYWWQCKFRHIIFGFIPSEITSVVHVFVEWHVLNSSQTGILFPVIHSNQFRIWKLSKAVSVELNINSWRCPSSRKQDKPCCVPDYRASMDTDNADNILNEFFWMKIALWSKLQGSVFAGVQSTISQHKEDNAV